MSRQNKINLVEAIYQVDPAIDDWRLIEAIHAVFGGRPPSMKTLSVWKARLRKKGVLIPDKRLKRRD